MAASAEQDLYDNADAKIRYEAYRCDFLRYEAYRWEYLQACSAWQMQQRAHGLGLSALATLHVKCAT